MSPKKVKNFHRILRYQIRKYLHDPEENPKEWTLLLTAVSDAYKHADQDRAMIERSLEISSEELMEYNKKLKKEADEAKKQAKKLQKLNKLMIGREIKMIEQKKEIKNLKAKLQKKPNKSK